MSLHTPIEWCDSTVNPTSGCDGCELYNPRAPAGAICYARAIHETRFALQRPKPGTSGVWQRNYAPTFSEVRMIPGRIAEACTWRDLRGRNREGKPWLDGLPRCIFVGDLSDIFSAAVTDDFLEREIFAPMESEKGRRHVWMVLTKRPKRMADFSEQRAGGLPRNVIAMASITNPATAAARIPHLLRVRARWRGISAEPLFEAVTIFDVDGPVSQAMSQLHPREMCFPADKIDWVIIGGASGANAVTFDIAWARSLVDECRAGGIAAFVKQLGARPVHQVDGVTTALVVGDAKKGGTMAEWPAGLAVREMPAFELAEVAA